MKFLRILALAAPIGLIAACGGSGASSNTQSSAKTATTAELAAATPSISGIGLVESSTDVAPSAFAPGPGPNDLMTQIDDDGCNPHLFLRSEEVVDRVNRHFYKFLVHVEDAIAKHPALSTGSSATWTVTRDDVAASLTVSKTGDTKYTWQLDLAPVSKPSASVEVADGTVDTTGATSAHQGSGTINVDLTALASVTREEVAGKISATFQTFASYKLTSVQATDVVWDTDSRNPFRAAPRSSSYVSYRQKGVGGSLVVQEDEAVPSACPRDHYSAWPMNPVMAPATSTTLTPATVDLVSRWYLLASPSTTGGVTPVTSPATSTVHGRSDAQMTGGALSATTIAKVVALTCHQSDFSWMTPAEGEWLLKAEDSTGATLWGREFVSGATPCDAKLGSTVPTLADSKNDFDFSSVSFTKPYLGYPGGAYPP